MDFQETFHCNGKVNLNDWELNENNFVLRGELENVSLHSMERNSFETDLRLFDHVLPASTAILNLPHFSRCMEMQLKILNRHESPDRINFAAKNKETDFYEIRKSISDFVSYIRAYLFSLEQQCQEAKHSFLQMENELDDTLSTLRRFFGRLRDISDSIFHYAPSNLGNKSTQPEFHLYHMHLELRWLFITIIHSRTVYSESSNLSTEDLDSTLQLVIDDLIYVSLKMFERISLTDLRLRTPYSCTCIREFWLMIQIFLEDVGSKTKCKTFWEYVNFTVDKLLRPTNGEAAQKIFWHLEDEQELPRSKNPELFAAWLIYHLALLHGYNSIGIYIGSSSTRVSPNYEQMDKILKGFVSKGGKDGDRDELDDELRVMIPLLRVLVDEWWPFRVQIISFLWDCFHRRLEQPFLLQTSGPWSASVEKISPSSMLKQIRDRIDGNIDQGKESSYGMFLRFLGTFLRKIYDKNDTRLWNQVKGRIYSKFSKIKVQEFGEAGLYNFITLFLTLALTADTTNVCSVMLDLLPPVEELTNERGKRYNLSWKGKLAVLLLYNENSMSLESIVTHFVNVVNAISCRNDDNSRSMMDSFVETFGQIVKTSGKFDNGEYLFVVGWIDRYLLECPKNRRGPLIRILLEILEKCSKLDSSRVDSGAYKILDALWSLVAGRVRQLVFEPPISGNNYVDLAKLAEAFTVEALRNPAQAKRHKHSPVSLFQHFTSSVIVADVRITKVYLVLILRKHHVVGDLIKEVKHFDLLVIQAWVKCCILGQDTRQDEDMRFLKNQVSQFSEVLQLFSGEIEILEFETSNESIFYFFDAIAKHRKSLKTEQERNILDARVRLYFNKIDKWAIAPINEESRESDLAFWIYRCIGTLILSCSTVLYVKNQSNNMLRVLVNKFVLTTEPVSQAYLKNLGKRIFSMVMLGIESLSARSDLSLQALIRDLFEAYLPLLVTVNTGNIKVAESLLQCFADAKIDFSCLLFEKLAASFIIVSTDNTTHKHCYLVMILLRNLLKSGKLYGNHIIEFIVAICVPNVISCFFKVHNLHPHRQQTLDLVSEITTNPYYREDSVLREKFRSGVTTVLLKFLTFNTQCTFDFLRSMIKINEGIVSSTLPEIEKVVADLEKSRRPNAASLRYSLSQLKNILGNS
ncbi:protein MMS22-like [Venturia canescens]|uniref:protein MMS22-like n=1 Tax=Venturia canescens TaxID=32260 RepID=UPI001C9CEEBE|nr:protein MMS22-like [Venturia canescens]